MSTSVVATRAEIDDAPIKQMLKRAEAEIGKALRGPIEAPVLVRSALLQVSMTPALVKVADTRDGRLSIIQAVMQAAQLGLMVGGPSGEAALVPYKGKAKLIPMVRGLTTLAIRSGAIQAITPRTVYPEDQFEVWQGTRDEIIHRPDLTAKRDDDTRIIAVYTVITLASGLKQVGNPMTRDEIERVRAVSKAGTDPDSPWVQWWGQQANKTVVKRDTKLMPLSPEFRAAVELDNRFETGTINEPSSLLDTAEEVEAHVVNKTSERAADLKRKLNGECEACGQKGGQHADACPHNPQGD